MKCPYCDKTCNETHVSHKDIPDHLRKYARRAKEHVEKLREELRYIMQLNRRV